MAANTVGPADDVPLRPSPVPKSRVKKHVTSKPASSTGIIGAALVIFLKKVGVELTVEDSVIIVAAAARIAEWLAERFVK